MHMQAKQPVQESAIAKAERQVIEQQKQIEMLKQQVAAAKQIEAEVPDEPDITDEPQERVYSSDQLQIALCCEAITRFRQTLQPGTLDSVRLEMARLYLLELGGMPEFLPRQQPAAPAGAAAGEPGDDMVMDEDRLPEPGMPEIPGTGEGSLVDQHLDQITAQLQALDKKEIMEKPPEKPVKKSALDGLLNKITGKPDEEPAKVDSKHQPVTIG